MNQKKVIIIALVSLGILILFMLGDYKNKGGLNGGAVSPNILYITQPVYSFSGIVEKIEGNKLTVTQKQTLTQNMTPAIAGNTNTSLSPFPTPKTITMSYFVLITDKTSISQPAQYINYLFKTVTPTPQTKLTVKNIKVGQNVTINSQTDLRTLSGDTFEATSVNLPQINNTLNGKIVSISDNSLTLKAFVLMNYAANPGNAASGAAPQEKEYRITLTSDTEISRMPYTAVTTSSDITPPKAEKMSSSDLKKDMQVTVYTAQDVTVSKDLTALRIEPIIVPATTSTPFVPPSSPLPSTATQSGINTIPPPSSPIIK